MPQSITFQKFGEQTILISWPNTISQLISEDIYLLNQKIHQSLPDLIIETVTAYCSLTLFLKSKVNLQKTLKVLESLYFDNTVSLSLNPKTWYIPVCYDSSFAIDLQKLAGEQKMSVDTVIKLHVEPIYTVDFLGFLPGFPYLSGLNPRLYAPRLNSPRLNVAKGSVAIGGNQTGIYPVKSPGGWHIIGRTPLNLFDVKKCNPCFIQPMDKIKFQAISLEEFNRG